jgi:hypothetical protein
LTLPAVARTPVAPRGRQHTQQTYPPHTTHNRIKTDESSPTAPARRSPAAAAQTRCSSYAPLHCSLLGHFNKGFRPNPHYRLHTHMLFRATMRMHSNY